MKILYIVGPPRSASTLLGMMLGEIRGFTYVGELLRPWRRRLDLWLCGCGKRVIDCDFWNAALMQRSNGRNLFEDERLIDTSGLFRIRHIPRLLEIDPGKGSGRPALDRCLTHFGHLLSAVAREAGARVVVDSSKTPAVGAALRLIPGIEPYFVNLIRDPWATAASWRYPKPMPPGDSRPSMQRRGLREAAKMWRKFQRGSEAVRKVAPARSIVVRYEDLVATPRQSLESITRLLGEAGAALPLLDEHTMRLGVHHSVVGNPDRFASGDIALRAAGAARRPLPWASAMIVSALSFPVAARYGYGFMPKRGAGGPSP